MDERFRLVKKLLTWRQMDYIKENWRLEQRKVWPIGQMITQVTNTLTMIALSFKISRIGEDMSYYC